VRIVLDEPVIARAGDRFVLRSASPLATIGGGIVTDANASRRARPMAKTDLSPAERLERIVTESGAHGVAETAFATRIGVRPSEAPSLAKGAGLVKIGSRWYGSGVVDELRARLLKFVKAHHEQRPTDPGAPRQDIRSRLGLDAALFDDLVDRLVADKKLVATGAELRVAGRAAGGELTDQQRKLSEEILTAIAAAGNEPPSVPELQTRFGVQVPALLRFLERQQRVIQVEDARYYAPEALRDLLDRLERGMAGKGELAPTDLRTVLGFSRKFLIPFLEYCDKRGYTARVGNGRVWRAAPGSHLAPPGHEAQ
jgi:selenocysteine-specific elongation factor